MNSVKDQVNGGSISQAGGFLQRQLCSFLSKSGKMEGGNARKF